MKILLNLDAYFICPQSKESKLSALINSTGIVTVELFVLGSLAGLEEVGGPKFLKIPRCPFLLFLDRQSLTGIENVHGVEFLKKKKKKMNYRQYNHRAA